MVPALKPTEPRRTKVESVLKNYSQEKANCEFRTIVNAKIGPS